MPATSIELDFADGAYEFALKLPQLAELQDRCKAGILTIYGRVLKGHTYLKDGRPYGGLAHEGEAFTGDVYETIRLGLIGGGRGIVDDQEITVSALVARRLVDNYVYPMPFKDAWAIAAAILHAKVEGYEPPKKAPPAPEPASEEATGSI